MSLVAALAILLCQEKITLKSAPKQGDKLATSEKFSMKVDARIVSGAREEEMAFESRFSRTRVTDFATVVEGRATKLVIEHEEDVAEQKPPGREEWIRRPGSLHGKTITILEKDGAIVREGGEGVPEKQLERLTLTDPLSFLFPKKEIAPGDQWEVTGEDLKKVARDDSVSDGVIRLKFTSVKEVEGRRCAILDVDFDLRGRNPEAGFDIEMKMGGEAVVWIERGYVMSARFKGTAKIQGEREGMSITGEGPLEAEIESKLRQP